MEMRNRRNYNPIRGTDTQLGDDGDVDRAMENVMACE
jgi:hypothetical protein